MAIVIVPAEPAVTASVHDVPEPVNAPRVPPVTVISDAVKSGDVYITCDVDVNRFACSDVGVRGGKREGGLTLRSRHQTPYLVGSLFTPLNGISINDRALHHSERAGESSEHCRQLYPQ